jgi:hypothetical protein
MADPDEGKTFDDAVAQFLREYFEAEPVGASFYGLTEWDGRLPDLTADGFAAGRRRRPLAGALRRHGRGRR